MNNIQKIDSYKIEKGKKEEEWNAVIRTGAETDIRKELFYRLASADMPIMQLGISEKSLEDVFLELTGEVPERAEEVSEADAQMREAEEAETEVAENDSDF